MRLPHHRYGGAKVQCECAAPPDQADAADRPMSPCRQKKGYLQTRVGIAGFLFQTTLFGDLNQGWNMRPILNRLRPQLWLESLLKTGLPTSPCAPIQPWYARISPPDFVRQSTRLCTERMWCRFQAANLRMHKARKSDQDMVVTLEVWTGD